MPAHKDWLIRFLERIAINEKSGCWEWIGPYQALGYGQLMVKRADGRFRPELAHRISYQVFRGPIPTDIYRPTIDHLCRNRKCVNPAHLETVTNRENILRGISSAAKRAAQTHCKRGHEFTIENTVRRSNRNSRECCKCKQAAERKRRRTTFARKVLHNLR